MLNVTFDNINQSYPVLIQHILDDGKEISPRGLSTKELSPVTITITNPLNNIIFNETRKLNYGFMLGELAWILQQSDDVEHICHYNNNWRQFSDDGISLNGAYGKRIFRYGKTEIDQFRNVIAILKKDPESRQAVIVLFDPSLDYLDTKDKPCTNLIKFMIRNKQLHMLVFMRSNDLILGYPYDVFNFTSLQALAATMLKVEVGTYTHVVDSLHVYTSQLSWCEDIAKDNHVSTLYFNHNMNSNDRQTFLNIEQTTRKLSQLDIKYTLKMLDDMDNDYWRSNAAFLALYNYRKARYGEELLSQIRPYITNELTIILDRYKALT